jgi:hypothetical protein
LALLTETLEREEVHQMEGANRLPRCQPIGTFGCDSGLDGSGAGEHAPCYASVDMTLRSRVVRPVADLVGRVFSRLAAVVVGFVLMATGVGLTVTIVMLPVGIVLGLLGVAIFVGGLFAGDGSHPF